MSRGRASQQEADGPSWIHSLRRARQRSTGARYDPSVRRAGRRASVTANVDDGARIDITAALPRRAQAGSVIQIEATVVNRSAQTLASVDPNPVSISYRWHEPAAGTLLLEGHRARLPAPLAPRATVRRTLELLVPERVGELVLVLTLVHEGVEWFDDGDKNAVVGRVEVAELDESLRTRFPPPVAPFEEGYGAVHGHFLDFAFTHTLDLFRTGAALPPCYGAALDERVVEYPWLLAQPLLGRMLDAGSTLNNPRMLDQVLRRVDDLHVVTLAPEHEAAWERGVSYVFADLRELPYRDQLFDIVACISTLEHVGMDNSFYGDQRPPAVDADDERLRGASELWRVLKPGGVLLLTVPCGRYADHGWFATLDLDRLEALADHLGPATRRIELFRAHPHGWQRASAAEVVELVSRDSHVEPVGHDLIVGARAVACMRLVR